MVRARVKKKIAAHTNSLKRSKITHAAPREIHISGTQKQGRRMTKEQQLYGIFADEEEEWNRKPVERTYGLAQPLNFVKGATLGATREAPKPAATASGKQQHGDKRTRFAVGTKRVGGNDDSDSDGDSGDSDDAGRAAFEDEVIARKFAQRQRAKWGGGDDEGDGDDAGDDDDAGEDEDGVRAKSAALPGLGAYSDSDDASDVDVDAERPSGGGLGFRARDRDEPEARPRFGGGVFDAANASGTSKNGVLRVCLFVCFVCCAWSLTLLRVTLSQARRSTSTTTKTIPTAQQP